MRFLCTFLAAIALTATAMAQTLPQFTSEDYQGWTYNNPGIALSETAIANGKVVLYVDQQGKTLMLRSPAFACRDMDSITARINWYTPQFKDEDFDLSLTALTLALDDTGGQPIDSVTVTPTTPGTSRHILNMAIAVPDGTDSLSMRLVCWNARTPSFGAVKQAIFQAVQSMSTGAPGDVNADGKVDVADVSSLIMAVLGKSSDNYDKTHYDLNADNKIDVSDVSICINIVLGRE